MKEIQLTRDQIALVDDEDYARLSQRKWYAVWDRTGYVARRGNTSMHREILHPSDDVLVDHINGNTLDNRRSNLRIATPSQNKAHTGPRKWKKFKGTCCNEMTGMFHASIAMNGKRHYLGRFRIEEDAAKAYDRAAKKLHGEFAWLNFPTIEEMTARGGSSKSLG